MILFILCSLLTLFADVRAEINCYKCSSRGGSNQPCHDPFSPAESVYVRGCRVPKRNHVGVFPANFCVKLTGVSSTTGDTLVIRDCVLKNMESQCGAFKFQNETLHGCVLTCNYDGCNSALSARHLSAAFKLLLTVSLLLTCSWSGLFNQL